MQPVLCWSGLVSEQRLGIIVSGRLPGNRSKHGHYFYLNDFLNVAKSKDACHQCKANPSCSGP